MLGPHGIGKLSHRQAVLACRFDDLYLYVSAIGSKGMALPLFLAGQA